jgi:hypothetical protein
MIRLAALTAGVALSLSTGCMHDGEWSVRKAIGWDDPPGNVVKPTNKELAKLPVANQEVARRVEDLGRKIVYQNTFIGIEPMFMTLGVKEAVLFHRGADQLFISEGLVEKCKLDSELAAVLCSELGRMVAETRTAKAVGHDVQPIPDAASGGTVFPGSTPTDVGRQAEQAMQEHKLPKAGGPAETADAVGTARDLLKGAGYSPAELDRIDSLLKQSDRGEKLKKQLGGGSAPAPEPFVK